MNVLYILNEAGMGGDSQSLLEMILRMNDIILPYVVIMGDGAAHRTFSENGIKNEIVRFETGYGLPGSDTDENRERNFKNNYAAAITVADIINREKIDIVNVNSSTSNVGAIAAFMTGVHCVWHLREVFDDFGYPLWDPDLKKKLWNASDSVIAISDYAKRRYYELYGISASKMYDGFELRKYPYLDEREKAGDYRILFASGVFDAKGIWDAVLSVIYLVNEEHVPVELFVSGHKDRETFFWIEKAIKKSGLENKIHIFNFVDDLTELRWKCNIAIICSKAEALGRVTVEAMLMGCLVIGAATGATCELIGTDESRGVLYERGNYVELAKKIKKLIDMTPADKKRMTLNARSFAEQQFDLKHYSEQMLNEYERILEVPIKSDARKQVINELDQRYINEITFAKPIPSKPSELAILWNKMSENKVSLPGWLIENGYRNIVLYGMGRWGKKIYKTLCDSDVSIAYFIDKNPGVFKHCIEYRSEVDQQIKVDLVLVCVLEGSKEICDSIDSSATVMDLSGLFRKINYG